MKKIIAVLLLMLVLAGCGTTQTNQTQPSTTSAPTASVAPATTVPEIVLTEAVNAVFLQSGGERMEIFALDHRYGAVMEKFFDLGGAGKVMTQIRLVDLYTGEVRKEQSIQGEWSLLPQGGCEGYVYLMDEITTEIRVLDRELEVAASFTGVGENGVISADLRTYYYLFGDKLFAMEGSTGETRRVEAEFPLSVKEILGYDQGTDTLFLSVFTDPYGTEYCVCALDPHEGKAMFLNASAGKGGFAAEGYCLQEEDTLDMAGNLTYCSADGDVFWTVENFVANSNDYATWHIVGSNYLYKLCYDKAQKVDVVKAELYAMGRELQVCALPAPLKTAKISRCQMLSDGNLLLVTVSRRGYQIYVVVPQLLEFTPAAEPEVSSVEPVDQQVLQSMGEGMAAVSLSEAYSAVRAEADRLEETYDIGILMSAQCAKLAQSETAPLVTTDAAGIDNEVGVIANALKDLETALKRYPEGFFSQFREDVGERGVLVLLVEDIQLSGNVIGVCYMLQNQYIVAVDITSSSLVHTYCHELWHATENKINSRMPLLISDKVWAACNPDGFDYSYSTDDSFWSDTKYTFFYENDPNMIYFIDPYGKTQPQEDRARLMEYVMADDYYAKEICRIPALKKKLGIMSDAVRQVFNTEGWETPYWERYQ